MSPRPLPDKIDFLSVADVDRLHDESLRRFDGRPGVRERSVLESAIMMPQQGVGGSYFHEDLAALAAAYRYHIAEGQPYVDGNKRAGVAAALQFLALNGIRLDVDEMELYEVAIGCAHREGHVRLTKDDVIGFFRRNMPAAG